jgi:hypothetical protein
MFKQLVYTYLCEKDMTWMIIHIPNVPRLSLNAM